MGRTVRGEALKLILCILVCQSAGFVGSLFTTPAILTWYATLTKPSFTPPNWVFGPVWVTLYLMMGIAAFLVLRRGLDNRAVVVALSIFGAQLLLNAAWSILFFGLRSPLAGLIDIALLWSLLLVTIVLFMKISTAAGVLLIPYILWVSFAAVLNAAIWMLN